MKNVYRTQQGLQRRRLNVRVLTISFQDPVKFNGIQMLFLPTHSGTHKSRRNLRRLLAATQITHQTMGQANPTAELILHTLIHSHDNLHPVRMLKIRNTKSITSEPNNHLPAVHAPKTNKISKVEKPKERQILNSTGLISKCLLGNHHSRLPVERSSAE